VKIFAEKPYRTRQFRLPVLVLAAFFFSGTVQAGSIREVKENGERVQSIELPYPFAVIGDNEDGERIYLRLMSSLIGRNPGFIIHLGDMVSKPDPKEWDGFFEISETVQLPFFPVLGNHDAGTGLKGREIYRKQFQLPEEKPYYSFRVGTSLFVVLDSEEGRGRILEEQWAWMEDVLSSSNEPFKLVFIHRPLFPPIDSMKRGQAMDRYIRERDNLHRLFVKTGVRMVFAGDDHRYDRRQKDGILYIITGGGGSPIYALKDRGGYFHYVWVSVEPGKVRGEVIDLEGQIRDQFVIE